MTNDLLIALGKANLAAGAAVVAVIAVRKLVRKAFGAKLAYALWLAVPLAAIAVLLPARTMIEKVARVSFDVPALIPAADDVTQVTQPDTVAALDPWLIAGWLWIAGALVTAAWLMRKQAAFHADERVGKAGPAVVGVIRPRIVTPSNFAQVFSEREQAVVLAHETAHIARNDVRANALTALVRCVCWFNPLIHVAAFLMRIDQELACDAQVVERHPKARRTYAEAMLKAELAGRPLPLGCCWPAAGTVHPLTERIAMLKHDNPSRPRRLIGAASILALCAGAGLAAWAAQPAEVEYVPIEQPQAASATEGFAPVPKSGDGFVPVPKPDDGFVPVPQSTDGFVPVEQPARASVPSSFEPAPESPRPAPAAQELPRYAPLGHETKDRWAPVSISGTITDVKWLNPNVQIFIHGDDGKDWYVLTSTVNHVLRAGGSRDIIRKDVRITLNGQRALEACAPLCIAMGWETDMTFNGAKLSPSSAQPVPTSFEPSPAPPQPVEQTLPTMAPFPGWTTPHSKDNWVPVTISGTITDVKWVNPSTQIFIHGDDGRNWYLLSSTPNSILRAGGSRELIRKDVKIVAQARQDADIACIQMCVAMAQVGQLVFDGKKLNAAPQPTAYQPDEPQRSPGAPVAAQSQSRRTFTSIVVKGNVRMSTEDVLSYIHLKAGNAYDPEAVRQAFYDLQASGQFASSNFMLGPDDTLVVNVVEKPSAYEIPESLLHLADAIDVTAPVAVTGTIASVEWLNPSTLIHVHGSDGQEWVVASGTPNTLLRSGVNREFLKVGSQFGAAGLRALNKSCDRGCVMYAEPAAMLSNGAKP